MSAVDLGIEMFYACYAIRPKGLIFTAVRPLGTILLDCEGESYFDLEV